MHVCCHVYFPSNKNYCLKYNGVYLNGFTTVNNLVASVSLIAPDIIHFQALTKRCSIDEFKALEKISANIIITIHVPGIFCQRGTMMYLGQSECDGLFDEKRCSDCYLQKKKLSYLWRNFFKLVPMFYRKFVAKNVKGRLKTVLNLPLQITNSYQINKYILNNSKKIIVVSEWLKNVILINGLEPAKIVFSRQGFFGSVCDNVYMCDNKSDTDCGLVRYGYLGRVAELKGLLPFINAFNKISCFNTSILEICCPPPSVFDQDYFNQCLKASENNRNIIWCGLIGGSEKIKWLKSLDALVVPSIVMETGPLVVYEAFQMKIPVIGSNLGGIKELVRHGVDGLLISPFNMLSWIQTLDNFSAEPDLRRKLRDNILPVRTMSNVADDMISLYKDVLAESGA